MPLTEPYDDHLPQEDPVALDGAVGNPDDNVVTGTSGASDPTTTGDGPAAEPEPTLPEPVRQRIVTLTAAVLPTLPTDEVPVPLRRVAKFAPNRRARLGAPVIAAQLTADPLFRQRVTARVLADAGDLGAAVVEGTA
ncbi:hypothetical protein PSH25_004476, partial [Micromonospora sp. PSH25]|nr:hypothetical protein [Micromonospora foliorum]